ncbi:SDR family NAD(P)-dependent oxidoreductase [Actinoallomurus sp. NPDC052274]|uniref:SDR family NAD(P)-dependent oxidoreductase n=1 Tax=Actinoallomurus sp. NPDC052274 TaxID=3155420 RepID=UPI0034157F98
MTAFVTGASTGFGAAITRRLAVGGTHVVASARRAGLLAASPRQHQRHRADVVTQSFAAFQIHRS